LVDAGKRRLKWKQAFDEGLIGGEIYYRVVGEEPATGINERNSGDVQS